MYTTEKPYDATNEKKNRVYIPEKTKKTEKMNIERKCDRQICYCVSP